MPILKPNKFADVNYRIKTMQEIYGPIEEEEKEDLEIDLPEEYTEPSQEIAINNPVTSYTLEELRADPTMQAKYANVFGYMNDNQETLWSAFDTPEPELDNVAVRKENFKRVAQKKQSPDVVEWLRQEAVQIPTLFSRASMLENAPEDVIRDYVYIKDHFDAAKVGGDGYSWLTAFGDYGEAFLTDPLNVASLALIPLSGGGSAATRAAAQLAAKESAKKTIAQTLKNFAGNRANQVMAVEGAVFTGLGNYAEQTRNVAIGAQEEINLTETALFTAGGAIAAPVLGRGLEAGVKGIGKGGKKVFDYFLSPLEKKKVSQAASSQNTATRDLAENGLDGELLDREQAIAFDAQRLGFNNEGSDFIEGVFSVIEDPKEVIKVVNTYARKEGLSDDAVEEMVEGILLSGAPTKGRIAQAIANTGHFLQKLPAYYGGKVSTLLDPYVGKSSTMAQLQKKFRYDQQRSITGERAIEGADYSEVLGEVFGRNFVRYKQAFDPILVSTYGWERQRAYGKLASAVRGKLSGDEVIDEAAKKIRLQLDDTAKELQEVGLYEEAELITGNYFPRLWNRNAIKKNQVEFKKLLLQVGEAADEAEADDIILGMLTKKFDAGDEGTFSGGSFLSKRKFDKITDDTMFEKFLDNDANNVLQSYYNSISKQIAKQKVFGATNFKGLKDLHLGNIQKELMDSGEQGLAETVEKDLYSVWSAQTGEGVAPLSAGKQFAVDTVSTFTRISLLPLATLSSLTEVMLNMSRGGLISTSKHFAGSLKEGGKILTYNALDLLMKNHNMTKPQALRKMQKFSIALDQSVADQVERLSGDNLHHWRKTNNVFFKANLLEPWTKAVQLTSFNVGRDIISNNLKALAKNQGQELTTRLSTKRDELLELGIDIDKGLAWINRTGGDVNTEDDFMQFIDQGAARYTNEIILNPSRESGLRSKVLSGNPFTTLLFQLTAYPSAFTNTVLKDLMKRTSRNIAKGDVGASAQVVGTVLALQAGGMLNNYARNELFGRDTQYRYKTEGDKVLEGAARWGGNGLYLDVLNRAKEGSERQGDIFAAGTSLFGPIAGSTYSSIKTGNPGAFVPMFFPLYGALSKEDKRAIRKEAFKKGTELKEALIEPKRSVYKTGGEVLDVPNASSEPDERIDKMTGMPYNQQAGAAFTDVEDREDPLQRMNFVAGGLAKMLSKTIQNYSKRIVNDTEAEEAAEEILQVYRVDDSASELDDPDFVAFLDLETKALLEEKHDLSMDQIRAKYPEFIDDDNKLIMGEEFSRARGYTDDEIETFKMASDLADTIGDSAQDETAHIQHVLNTRNLIDKPPENNLEESLSKILAKKETIDMGDSDPFYEKMYGENYKEQIAALSPEDRAVLDSLEVPAAPTRPEKVREIDLKNRDKALKSFLKDSKEKEAVYRGTSHGFDTDYEVSFAMPKELGTHVGSRGQATSILARTPEDPMPLGEVSEDVMNEALQMSGMDIPKTITKGYINVKNPLVLEDDFGNWGATEILSPDNASFFVNAIVKQAQQKGVTSEVVMSVLKRKIIPSLNKVTDMSQDGLEGTLQYNIYNAKLNKDLQRFLKDFGFDSVKYKNTFETRLKNESPYSYILFEPQQFKSTFASRFDKADPRQNKNEGGLLTKKGRKVYKGKDGQPYSERTVTFQIDNKWVNYPSVDLDGNQIPERLLKKLAKNQASDKGVVDFITGEVLPFYKNKKEAIKAAKERSSSLLDKVN